jgi:hypothetical protein
METTREVPPAVEALVEAVTQSYGQLALIVDHMARNASDDPEAPPFDVVLRGLLGDVLARLPDLHGVDDVATTAQMLRAATEVIAEEIYLVGEPPPNRAERRRRRG